MPNGYHQLESIAPIGNGRRRFEQAADAVLHWGMQRGAGLRIRTDSDVAAVDAVVVVRMAFLAAPCRVVYVVSEPDRRGFAYRSEERRVGKAGGARGVRGADT